MLKFFSCSLLIFTSSPFFAKTTDKRYFKYSVGASFPFHLTFQVTHFNLLQLILFSIIPSKYSIIFSFPRIRASHIPKFSNILKSLPKFSNSTQNVVSGDGKLVIP
ncbi:hypothetical protein B9Z55_001331 [Caenorhabditis nigoni]|uniref:Uncharacterized protein n=1 Tax=Caenorhabditis nigoni TaxID=1611254 RepID=A0A2G5VF82_9PELO|nr:hypothetical protein B9Z55_001331 [Caenorhabditis nigoni]